MSCRLLVCWRSPRISYLVVAGDLNSWKDGRISRLVLRHDQRWKDKSGLSGNCCKEDSLFPIWNGRLATMAYVESDGKRRMPRTALSFSPMMVHWHSLHCRPTIHVGCFFVRGSNTSFGYLPATHFLLNDMEMLSRQLRSRAVT